MVRKDRIIEPIPDTFENIVDSLFRADREDYSGLQALERFSFKKSLGINAECYCLNDADKSIVITTKSIATLLAFDKKTFVLNELVDSLKPYLDKKAIANSKAPIQFNAALTGKSVIEDGYDISLLVSICFAIIDNGTREKDKTLANAKLFVRSIAKSGVNGLFKSK